MEGPKKETGRERDGRKASVHSGNYIEPVFPQRALIDVNVCLIGGGREKELKVLKRSLLLTGQRSSSLLPPPLTPSHNACHLQRSHITPPPDQPSELTTATVDCKNTGGLKLYGA